MAKEFRFQGKTVDELQKVSMKEFSLMLPARERRSITRGLTAGEKIVLKKLKEGKTPETHAREMIIFPEMVGKMVKVHDGKGFAAVRIQEEMIGRHLGEFAPTRKKVIHHSPGIGATRSSASLSVK